MGFGPLELFIILAIVLVLFGAKKLRNIGGDLGGAIKNFKSAVKEEETAPDNNQTAQIKEEPANKSGATIEGTVENKTKENV
ncbi:MAG: Sec-independent protein translocase subunit TatA [Gammaproteobacteria bacterium]|nr:Sec-independent protein translocase subunit TatA [Gammaproteobacteria bacterium]